MSRQKTQHPLHKESNTALLENPTHYSQETFLEKEIPAEDTGPETSWEQNAQIVIATDIPKMEKVTFYNLIDHGKSLEFFYASKTHPLKHYKLDHGNQYDLPYEIIDHLEGSNETTLNSCCDPVYKNITNEHGKLKESKIDSYKPKYQCKRVRR